MKSHPVLPSPAAARALAPALAVSLFLLGCASTPSRCCAPATSCPLPGGKPVDELIQPGEEHFAHLWQLSFGGENAEAYWSCAGDRLVFQRRDPSLGIDCDRIFVTLPEGGEPVQVSSGKGVTTCAYFLPGDEAVLYASTHGHQDSCPPPPDYSQGYVWPLHPEYDVWVRDLDGGAPRPLTGEWGYDAEATISPCDDRIVFTSTRSGDLELWTCDLDGSDLFQVTDALGYDGGAFFSHDGERLVFRTSAFTPGQEAEEEASYRELLGQWKIRPSRMEIMVIDTDGSNRRQLTNLGKASFAPYFYPDDSRVIFSSNHASESGREFDLYSIGVDGEGLERITSYEGFDSFPMFSPDGRYLAFSSNRGGTQRGETNMFVAAWRGEPCDGCAPASRNREPGAAGCPAPSGPSDPGAPSTEVRPMLRERPE